MKRKNNPRQSQLPCLSKRHSWREMLEAVPIRNSAVTVSAGRNQDELNVKVPNKRPRYQVPPICWVVPYRPYRTFVLDTLGSRLWMLCDGKRSVEKIVDEVARQLNLSFHESRVAVTEYIRTLIRGGALAIEMKNNW